MFTPEDVQVIINEYNTQIGNLNVRVASLAVELAKKNALIAKYEEQLKPKEDKPTQELKELDEVKK